MIARLALAETLFGFVVVALGVFMLVAGSDIFSPVIWGPALAPKIIAWGLVLLGTATAIERLCVFVAAEEVFEKDWSGFAWTLGAVVAFGALVELAGFPLAAGVMFALVARGFGSPRLGKDFLIGFALAGIVYAVFGPGLGMQLSWGGLLESAIEGR